jgi:hypothetical protein
VEQNGNTNKNNEGTVTVRDGEKKNKVDAKGEERIAVSHFDFVACILFSAF